MSRLKQPPETATYTFLNVNPRDLRVGDCVVRAIATATDKSWDEVFDGLCEIARKVKSMPNAKEVYPKYLKSLGWIQMAAPKKMDNHRYTGKEFAKIHKGKAVLNIGSHHVTALMNHKVVDIWDCTDGAVGTYWVPPEG